jgi:hypothetical protein
VNRWHFTKSGRSQICFSKRNGNQTRQSDRINVKTCQLDSQFSAVVAGIIHDRRSLSLLG